MVGKKKIKTHTLGMSEAMQKNSQTSTRCIILAVSGGIDSMTMLWLYRNEPRVVVAHFNHGTRSSADEDENFVRRVAEEYGRPFVSERAVLGEGVSEAEARKARYDFLRRVAEEYGGEVYVAHHLDDLVESVVINLLRGTGWRGLAVMNNQSVKRPLVYWDKRKIERTAGEAKLTFRQDPTNIEDGYLRNRVREKVGGLTEEAKGRLGELRQRQVEIAGEIDHLIDGLLPEDRIYQREWFSELDDGVAVEILRAGLRRVGILATRPQILDFLQAIREYSAGKIFNLPGGKLVKIYKTYFVL